MSFFIWYRNVLKHTKHSNICTWTPYLPFTQVLVAQLVKNPLAMQETPVRPLGQKDPLEKGQATHSSIPRLPWWLRWWRIHLRCRRPGFDTWVGKIPWKREQLHTPIFWSGESHGQRSPAGYSPWSHKELDATERLSLSRPSLVNIFNNGKKIASSY